LYSTNKLGKGNIFALAHFLKLRNIKIEYKPLARLKEGRALLGIAASAMDTSDGAISTLDQLMRLNNIGFELNGTWINSIEEGSIEIAKAVNIPTWLLLAGQHGEFELIFTIPQGNEFILLESAKKVGWRPLKIGKVIEEQKLLLPLYGSLKQIDTAYIRNLSFETGGNVEKYIKSLIEYDASLR
jgi:thiamine-monophosphate kinase